VGTIEALASIKGLARRWAAELYARSPGYLRQLEGKVTILAYHRVVTSVELSSQFIQPGMYVTRDTFDSQIRFLREYFDLLSMGELLSMWRDKAWNTERRYCVITFDDGWLDNYVHAFPILRRYDVPATIFLPTGYIGTTRWFWPEQLGWLNQRFALLPQNEKARVLASLDGEYSWFSGVASSRQSIQSDSLIECCKAVSHERIGKLVNRWAAEMEVRLPDQRVVLNWGEVTEMAAARISFGSHSVAHKILTTVSDTELHEEVHGSLAALREQTPNVVPVFCYPNGSYSPSVVRCVQSAGYSAATTTEPGLEDRDTSRMFQLRRMGVHNDMTCSDALFAFHLAGYNSAFHG